MKFKKITKLISNIFILFTIGIVLVSCDPSKLKETPVSKFEGNWELNGRKMFNGFTAHIMSGNWLGTQR